MAERRFVRGKAGAEVWVDIDRDMDQATFDRMVARGDLTEIDAPTASEVDASPVDAEPGVEEVSDVPATDETDAEPVAQPARKRGK